MAAAVGTPRRRSAAALSLAVAGLGFASAARADSLWVLGSSPAVGGTSGQEGDYNVATNWSPTGVPNNVNAVVQNGGTVDVTPNDPAWTVYDLRAGDNENATSGNGTYNQTGSSVTANSWFRLGADTAAVSGTYNLSGGSFLGHGHVNVGEAGTGTLNVSGTGTFSADGSMNGAFWGVGVNSGSKGFMTVSGTGTVNDTAGNDAAPLQIAANTGATGLVTLQDNGTINTNTNELWIGQGGTGTLNQTGGTLNVGNWIAIGRTGGTGVLNLSGGVINKTGNGNITFAGANNTLNQTGGILNNTTSQTWIGEGGTGATSVYNMLGGTANLGAVEISRNGGTTGTLNLSGGTFATTQIYYGAGTGIVNFNGGTLQANTNAVNPFFAGLTAANVLGPTSTIDYNGQNIIIGQPLLHGGTAAVDGGITIANSNANGGSVTFGGASTYTGTTTVTAGTTFALGNNVANTSSGSLAGPVANNGTLNFTGVPGSGTNGISTVGGAISGAGPINVLSGTAQFAGNGSTYTGLVTVNSGAALIIGNGGTTGSLSPTGPLVVQPGASFGYNRSDNIDQTAVLPGGATILDNTGTGTTTISAATGASTLNITNGVIYAPDPATFNTVTSVAAAYPGALAVAGAGESQAVLNLFTVNSGGVFALSTSTSNSLDFEAAALPNVRLGAFPAGTTVTYSGAINPFTTQNAGGANTGSTFVLGGGGGTLNMASLLADVNGVPSSVDINAGPVILSNAGNTFTGSTTVQPQGTLILPTSANIGILGGTAASLVLRGGVLQYQAGDPAPLDVTQKPTFLANAGSGAATVNTSNNAVTFAGPIGGAPTNASSTVLTSVASFTKAGAGSLTDTSTVTATQLFVRQGTMTFTGTGSAAALNSYVSVGLQPGDVGTLNVSNGAVVRGVTDFNLGDNSAAGVGVPVDTGIVNLTDATGAGTLLNSTTLYVAKAALNANGSAGSVGIFNQTGGTLNNSGAAYVGDFGPGTVNLTGGAFNVSGTAFVGVNAPAVGVLNVSGGTATFGSAATQNNNSQIGVNNGSTGVVNQTGGTVTFNNGFIALGRFQGSTGVYNLSAGTLNSTGGSANNFFFIVGESGNGTLNVSGTGTAVVVNGLGVSFSDGISSVGTVNQNGGTVTAAGLGVLYAQNATGNATVTDTGTYNLNGGTLNALSVRQVAPANGEVVTSTFNFNGGTLVATAPSAAFITGLTQANVLAGGANINTSTFAVTVPQPLVHGGTAATDGGLTVGGTGTLTLSGANTYTGLTTVNAGANVILSGSLPATDSITANGAFTFAGNASTTPGGVATRTKGTLTVGSTGQLTIGSSALVANRTLLIASALSDAGKVDIGNNDVIVHNGNIAALTAAAAAGYNSGAFNNTTGLVSSAALADTSRLTTVGVILNNTGTGSTVTNRFDLTPVSSTDVLIKYTYFGDANLDGAVDGSDYARIDAGFLSQGTANALTGWQNGDFNYDGKVDASDYTLIDNAFNLQNTTTIGLSALPGGGLVAAASDEIAPVVGTSAVPEPASIGLFAVAAGGLLARRRRA